MNITTVLMMMSDWLLCITELNMSVDSTVEIQSGSAAPTGELITKAYESAMIKEGLDKVVYMSEYREDIYHSLRLSEVCMSNFVYT